jgi:hypothetical protein
MRIVGLALTGVLALRAATPAHTDPLGSKMEPARRAPGVTQVWDGVGPGGHSAAIGGQRTAGHLRQWNGTWVRPHWRPNWNGGWVPNAGPGVPTYWVWGPSGGAFDYPFADWRGPTGGWGNP